MGGVVFACLTPSCGLFVDRARVCYVCTAYCVHLLIVGCGRAVFYQPNASTQKRSTGGFPKLAS